MNRLPGFVFLALLLFPLALPASAGASSDVDTSALLCEPVGRVHKSESAWKEELNAMRFHILREKGTERAFTGKLLHNREKGVYVCAGCGNPLFASSAKYDSRTGWPSFWRPIGERRIALSVDRSFFITRTELLCARCGGHLGHVFDDGPQPTGKRYCINSAALRFIPMRK